MGLDLPVRQLFDNSAFHGRLWSLWEMINFNFSEAYATLTLLNHHCENALRGALESRKSITVQFIDDSKKAEVSSKVLARCKKWFGAIGSRAIDDRIRRFEQALASPMAWEQLESQLTTLRDTLHDELQRQYFYRYSPPEIAEILLSFGEDWREVVSKFPSAKWDAYDAVDCIGLGKHTASVFHSMRVLEHGLRALAADVGKTFDVQNWQNIIDQIEAGIRDVGKRLPSGAQKNERLQFLSSAAKEFSFFKDGWRNYVSHNKCAYDMHQAMSVLQHVREFMTILSSQLSESGLTGD